MAGLVRGIVIIMDASGGLLDTARKKIDKIVYLASLVSSQRQIDPLLEDLRTITATKLAGDKRLNDQDVATLSHLESELTSFLVDKEPLLSLTPETLEQRVYEHGEAKALIRHLRWQVAGILGLAVLVVAGILFMTFEPASLRTDIALIGGTTICYLGSLFLFLSALKRFSSAIGTVYRLFCLGFFIGSLSILVNASLTLALAYNAVPSWDSLWILNLGLYAEYIPIYIASVRLARLQGIKTVLMNSWIVTAAVAGGSLLLALTPAGRTIEPEGGLIAAFSWMSFILALATAVLLLRVWKSYTTLYRSPSQALALTILTSSIGWAGFVVAPFLGREAYETVSNVSNLLFIVCTALLVRAGYLFSKLSRY